MTGPIFRFANLFTALSGATLLERLSLDFADAMASPDVQAVVFDIDSPGGQVTGTEEFAELVFRARGEKPVVAYVTGTGASAAYWIASAADEVIAGPTALLGSIGVVFSDP